MNSAIRTLCALGLLGVITEVGPAQNVPSGFQVDNLVNVGLPQPLDFSFLPDGRVLIANRAGELSLYAGGPVVLAGTVPSVLTGGESGLLSIEVDPSFAQTGYIYAYYTSSATSLRHVDRFALVGDLSNPTSTNLTLSLASRHPILDAIPLNSVFHKGGALRFGPDGMLYLTLGDDGIPCDSQSPASGRGSLLRLNTGNVPAGGSLVAPAFSVLNPGNNPLSGNSDFSQLVIAYGLRQPFRMVIDSLTGNVYIGDVGSSGSEEINEYLFTTGTLPLVNYGWPWIEGAVPYSNTCSGTVPAGLEAPIAIGLHTASWKALIQGPRYRNQGGPFDFGPSYEGSVFYVDYFMGWLRRLEDTSGWGPAPPVPGQPTNEDWGTSFPRVTAMRQGPDGAIYWTRNAYSVGSGRLYRVRPSVPSTAVTFGVGCGNPALDLSPAPNSPPLIGTTPQVVLTNVPSPVAFVAAGWSNTMWGPMTLPATLAGYGMPGCLLLQSSEWAVLPTTPGGAGTATFSLHLPNWGGLLGVRLFLQGWAPAPGYNTAGVIVSNGAEWVFGNS